jgi:hypothetical protein
MLHENAVVQQIQGTVTTYMRRESPFYEAQSAMEDQLRDLIDEIAQEVRDEYGDTPTEESIDEQERRKRSVYAQLIIAAERQARDDGRPLRTNEIEKLLRLMCWMCDTAKELEKYRPLPTASEAA